MTEIVRCWKCFHDLKLHTVTQYGTQAPYIRYKVECQDQHEKYYSDNCMCDAGFVSEVLVSITLKEQPKKPEKKKRRQKEYLSGNTGMK